MKSTKQNIITIIGAGQLGKALGNLIDNKQNIINYLDKNPSKYLLSESFIGKSTDKIISETDLLFLCIPSSQVRSVISEFKSFKKGAIVVCLSKGIEVETSKTMDIVLREVLPEEVKFALLYGPMLAKELSEGLPGFGFVATDKLETFEYVSSLFQKSPLHLEYSSNVPATAIAGALKNVYSLAMGIVEGLGGSKNVQGYVASLAIQEMKKIIGMRNEVTKEVESLLISDFIATAFSPHSRNHYVGLSLIKENKKHESEGSKAIAPLIRIIGDMANQLLLFSALKEIFVNNYDPKLFFKSLKI